MTRAALIAAALLLSGCATQPYGSGPYDQPYPPSGPYDPGGYPPPPGNYPPPPGMGPDANACPIAGSRNWQAWINAMPGPNAGPKLMLTGTVTVPTGGYRLEFVPHLQVRESYPAQAVATLVVFPPDGPATQALETHDLRWEWPVGQQIGSVTVRCGNQTLATISPVQRAY